MRGRGAILTISVFAASLAVMPLVYGLAAFHGDYGRMLKPPIIAHVACECAANMAVMLGSLRLVGRFDRKLAQVFARTLGVHGALAFLTLIFRLYFSIPMLLVGVLCSAILGALVMFIQHRTGRVRVGLLGPWHPILDERRLDWSAIGRPEDAIAPHDFLLVTFPGALPPDGAAALSRAMLAGKRVRHVAEYLEEARGVVAIEPFDLDHLPEAGLTSYRTIKRALDLLIVFATLPVTLPALALAALAVLVGMGRPVLFVQDRVGLGGRVFRMVKLRTMRGRSPSEVVVATARDDARITPLGRWLRRFHIDELPQLWNVLVGEMSLVGPRPEQPALAQAYQAQVPAFAYRHLVRPGITGWAQVRAPYAADLAETQVKLGFDLFYLKNFSFALDVQILIRTVWTVIRGGGVR